MPALVGLRSSIKLPAVSLIPCPHEDQPHYRTTQMGPVSHIVACRIPYTEPKFHGPIDEDKPFGFHRNEEIYINKAVGKQVTECCKASKNRPGCPDRWIIDDKIIDLSTKVVVELFKTLWQRKGFWESAIKNVR